MKPADFFKFVQVDEYSAPLKKLLLKGITTISTDFKLMGNLAAEMINKQTLEHHEVPFSIRLRPSL